MAQIPTQANPLQVVPMDVQQQAGMYNLGTITAVYKPRFTNPFLIIILAILAIVVDIVLLVAVLSTGFIFYIFIILPILFIIYMVRGVMNCNLRIFAFNEGFVRANGRKLDVARYDQIAQVFFIVRRGRYGTSSYTLTVVRSDGVTFKFVNSLQFLNTFGGTVQSEVSRRHVPIALDSFKRGNVIVFGPLNLSQQGIGSGQRMLPWNVVQPLILYRGNLIVKQIGQRSNFARVKVAQIPNLQVLLQVAKYAQSVS